MSDRSALTMTSTLVGTISIYEGMLDYVRDSYPDTESLYLVAMDILTHSDDQTVTNIMYLLEKGAVVTTFEIEEE